MTPSWQQMIVHSSRFDIKTAARSVRINSKNYIAWTTVFHCQLKIRVTRGRNISSTMMEKKLGLCQPGKINITGLMEIMRDLFLEKNETWSCSWTSWRKSWPTWETTRGSWDHQKQEIKTIYWHALLAESLNASGSGCSSGSLTKNCHCWKQNVK